MYHSTGKPSVAKFRARLEVIRKASVSGVELAEHWNPKGRNYDTRIQMMKFFGSNVQICDGLLRHINAGRKLR